MRSYFAEYGLKPAPCAELREFHAAAEQLCIARLAPGATASSCPAEGWAVVTEAELYAGTVRRRGRARARSAELGRRHAARPVRAQDRRPGGARAARHRPLPGLVNLDLGDGNDGVPAARVRRRRQALRAGVAARRDRRATPARSPRKRRCTSWAAASGTRPSARAAKQVRDTAAELLDLYAKRAARQGHAFSVKQHDLEAFADGFGFEETPDQAAAIEAVIADMTSGKPMDRLVCGDVGFGKTEVALRAAFVAVADGKQVAILVPDHAARRAALPDLHRPLRRLAGARSPSCRASAARKEIGATSSSKLADGRDRHRHRHAQAAVAATSSSSAWAW